MTNHFEETVDFRSAGNEMSKTPQFAHLST